MELCSGNSVALLAAPERLFASSDAKRARLHEHVLAALNESECSKQPQWLSRRFLVSANCSGRSIQADHFAFIRSA